MSENESDPEEAEPSVEEQEEEKHPEEDENAMHGASMTEIQNSMLRTSQLPPG